MRIRSEARRAARRAAFTLMEMMVVVAIIVALAGLGIFYMAGQADEGNKTRAIANLKSLTDACVAFKLRNAGEYPASLEQLLEVNPPLLANADALQTPWPKYGGYTYEVAGQKNGGRFPDIFCNSPFGLVGNWSKMIPAP